MTTFSDQLSTALGPGYQLERELLGGGMSRVFVALEKALGRRVVVKVLSPDLAAGVNRERFQREIQFAAQLQHPHIVPLLAAGEFGDLLWYTMPFIEGESLRTALERGERFSVRDVVRILREVADALCYAHERGLVHRDIKPANVLAQRNHAVVTDFGVAKALTAALAPDAGLTTAGMAIGTPEYMAPEQLAGDPTADARVDLYALGLLVYELLAGKSPFGGLSPRETLAAQLTKDPPPITDVRADVPVALAALITRCLEKDPLARTQSAKDILTELDEHPSAMITAPTALVSAPTVRVATGGGPAAITVPRAITAPAAEPVRRNRASVGLVIALGLVSAVAIAQFGLGRRAEAIARAADSARQDSVNKAAAAAAAIAAAAPEDPTPQLTVQQILAMADSIANERMSQLLAAEKQKGRTVDSAARAMALQAAKDTARAQLTAQSRANGPRGAIADRRLFIVMPLPGRGGDTLQARGGRDAPPQVLALRAAVDSLRAAAASQLRRYKVMPAESTIVRSQYVDARGFHPNDVIAVVTLPPAAGGALGANRGNRGQAPRPDSVSLRLIISEFTGGQPVAGAQPAASAPLDQLVRGGRNALVGSAIQGRYVPRPQLLLTTVPDLVKSAIAKLDTIGNARGGRVGGRRGGGQPLPPRGG